MRSYGWRPQATRAAAPRAAVRDSAIRVATTSAPAARSRAALLGSVWLGALAMLAPSTAHAVDGTWNGGAPPSPNEWTQATNWSSPTVPDGTATFDISTRTSVTISGPGPTSINTMEFTAAAPAYSFTVQNGATFTITGGIINNPSFEPAFTVNATSTLTVGNGGFAEIGSLAGGGTVTIGS